MISPNIIIPYDSTHASIPAGYVRETSLDGKYPKGTATATNPNTTGGAETHSHTSPSHSHNLNSHNHTGTTGARVYGVLEQANSGSVISAREHTHTFTLSSTISGGTTGSTAVTYGSVSNHPPYYEVIFIKSTGYRLIPNNAMVLSSATTRTGLSYHTASQNKFLRGAGTGANAGSTGGSTTNVHDISHAHSAQPHSHASSTTDGTSAVGNASASGFDGVDATHVHSMSVTSNTQAINGFDGSLTTTETVQPAYRTLNAFKNTSGANVLPRVGDIALWLGTLSSIPTGWVLCDGTNSTPDMRSRFLKITNGAGASTTGGSNTHTHASQSHTHTSNGSHAHVVSFGYQAESYDRAKIGGSPVLTFKDPHVHDTVWSNASAPTYASANTSADSSSNEPPYRTVAYIQMQFLTATSAPVIERFI